VGKVPYVLLSTTCSARLSTRTRCVLNTVLAIVINGLRAKAVRLVSTGILLALATAATGTWAVSARLATNAGGDFEYSDRADGLSCKFVDIALGVRWPDGRPQWHDADDHLDGPRPFATHRIESGDMQRVRRIDISALVQGWWAGRWHNDGLLVQRVGGSHAEFHAREDEDATLRPQLLLRWRDGRQRFVEPDADVSLDCATYKGLGQQPRMRLLGHASIALRFPIAAARAARAEAPISAELVLVRTPDSPRAATEIAVQRLSVPMRHVASARDDGIARDFQGDRDIGQHPDVLFADGFDNGAISPRWKRGMDAPWRVVAQDEGHGFVPLAGSALRVTIPRGGSVGLDLRYPLREHHGSEPEELYVRYCLRLAASWTNASDGGKLPGLAGTYGKAGWGGRRWDGSVGWSMRGHFGLPAPEGHAAAGRTMLGSYAYHSRSGAYGEAIPWAGSGFAGLLEPDRWVCIEQHLRLNTPGRQDGLLEVWVDGRLALSQNALRIRDQPHIRIEQLWMNVFHGGTRTAPRDMHLYIDGVVLARRYIGPLVP